MKLQEFFKDPVRRKEYKKWLSDPVTVRIVEILREVATPLPIDMTSGKDMAHQALYHLGYNIGQATLLNLMQGLDATSERIQEAQKALQPNYGADKVEI